MTDNTPTMRYFKIGSTKITETESMKDKTPDEIRLMLLTNFPELKTATTRQKTEDGVTLVEFIAKAGTKG